MHPILTNPFELEVDASGYALGAVLMQYSGDAKRHPVGFYSSTLTLAERNYDIYCKGVHSLKPDLGRL